MEALVRSLSRFDLRLVAGMGALLVAVLALEGWVLVLRAPLAAYQQQLDQRQLLELRAGTQPVQDAEIGRLRAAVAALEARQPTGRARLEGSEDAIVTTLIEVLDQVAKAHRVALLTVHPDVKALPGQAASPVRQSVPGALRFSVGASATYLDLAAWMLDFSEKFGAQARIDSYEMRAQETEEGRKITIELTLLLMPGAEGEVK